MKNRNHHQRNKPPPWLAPTKHPEITSFRSIHIGETLGVTTRRREGVLLRPAAFLKLMFCCHAATTEIGGFGISSATDPLVIEEFVLIRQKASSVTVTFDDEAVADHIDGYADRGVAPSRTARIWIHTHPGSSASPSGTDERTFASSFGGCDWSAMLMQSRGKEQYCRLQFSAGPGGESVVPVDFDWAGLPAWLIDNADALPALVRTWKDELESLVTVEECFGNWTHSLLENERGVDRGLRFHDYAMSSALDAGVDPRDVDEAAFLSQFHDELNAEYALREEIYRGFGDDDDMNELGGQEVDDGDRR